MPEEDAAYYAGDNVVMVNGVGFSTVLINKHDDEDAIVYVDQNDRDGFGAAEKFLIKDNPDDGEPVGNPITNFGDNGEFSFNVTNGTYTLDVECEGGYEVDDIKIGDTSVKDGITVSNARVSGIVVTAKKKLFNVTGTVKTPS